MYGSDAVVAPAELRRSVADNFTFMLGAMSASTIPTSGRRGAPAGRRAHEGVPLPELLRAYRLGFAFLWEELLAEARATGDSAVRALTDKAAAPVVFRRLRHRAPPRRTGRPSRIASSPPIGTAPRWSRRWSPAG